MDQHHSAHVDITHHGENHTLEICRDLGIITSLSEMGETTFQFFDDPAGWGKN